MVAKGVAILDNKFRFVPGDGQYGNYPMPQTPTSGLNAILSIVQTNVVSTLKKAYSNPALYLKPDVPPTLAPKWNEATAETCRSLA